MRIAINGFGRIGRMILRAFVSSKRLPWDVVAINDLSPPKTCAHLLRYDSIHGKMDNVTFEENKTNGSTLKIGDFPPIAFFSQPDPSSLPWKEHGIDLVLECTGLMTSHRKASQHLEAGAKKVLVSAPMGDADRMVVYGVNHETILPSDRVISNASCTTNCLAPLVRVLHDRWGIASGYMTTVHAVTSDQKVIDTMHPDLRRARASFSSMIPTSTGATKALSVVVPEIAGRLSGGAIRVPVSNVSMVDFSMRLEKPATKETIVSAMEEARDGRFKGILDVSKEPLVSCDINHNPFSCVYDSFGTQTLDDGSFAHIMAWYDNEWGFSNRMLDVATYLKTLS